MLVFYFIVIFVVGYMVASLLFGARRASLVEIVALSLICGLGAVPALLFIISLLSFPLAASALWILFLLTAIALLVLMQRKAVLRWDRSRAIPVHARAIGLSAIPVAAIVFCVVAAGWNATKYPLYDWDAFSVWLIKAKVLVSHPLMPVPEEFVTPALAYSHQDYPLAQPLLVAGAWAATGATDDHVAMLTLLLPWLAIGLLFAAEALRRLGAIAALWLTAILLSIRAPLLAAPSGSADVMLAAFYFAHVVFILRYLEKPTTRDIAAAGFFAGCMCFTKREGTALVIISALILLIFARTNFRDRARHLGLFAGVALIVIGPWLLWQTQLPHVSETYYGRLTPAVVRNDLARLPAIAAAIVNECTSWRAWDGLWLLLVIVAVFSIEFFRDRILLAIWLLLLGHFVMNALAFLVASDAIFAMMPPVLDRLTIHAFPAAALLIVLHWAKMRARSDGGFEQAPPAAIVATGL
jgi:hypothetical protein